jgi:histidyl-tRNA synthetase
MQKIQAIRGMNDILPDDTPLWEHFEDTCRDVFRQYGYANMRTPIVEATPLYVRSIGEVTDIVEKEMYSFEDKLNGEALTLRPEATAGLIRAAIEHNLTYSGPIRVWTAGPMFRHERPQKGRYRQFHQYDVEAFGFAGPDVDAEQMLLLHRLWRRLGLDGIELQINSVGDIADRQAYRQRLIDHFSAHIDHLDEDGKRRLHSNPLRLLDSKSERMQPVIASAPRLLDRLNPEAAAHFEGVQRLLSDAGLSFRINPRLVRGLDYYNRTVFEFVSLAADSPLTVAGGGRYDGLFEQLGGKPTPSIGFGLGVERVLMLMRAQTSPRKRAPNAYLVMSDSARSWAWKVAEALRDAGLAVVLGGGASFKSQMKKADGSGARFAIIVGDEEAAHGTVTLKRLADGEQQRVTLARAKDLLADSAYAAPAVQTSI